MVNVRPRTLAEAENLRLNQMKEEALTSALDQWMQESSIVYTEEGEKWKIPEDAEQPAEEEQAAAEEPAAETPAPEAPAAEETANP